MLEMLSRTRAFSRCRVAVVGDLMLDEYLWGHIERISPEAPVPILNVVHRDLTLGGAGNVAENLRNLGVQVTVFGVVGQDQTGGAIQDLLNIHGADTKGLIVDSTRKSTRKCRLMSTEHGQQVFRLDEESIQPVSGEVEQSLIRAIHENLRDHHAVICSDYMKGSLTRSVLRETFTVAARAGMPSIVGPKDSDSRKYEGAEVLMPNARELAQLVGTPMNGDRWLNESATSLVSSLNLRALVVTRGSEGVSLFESSDCGLKRVDMPTTARSVYDVTGAGDTAIATFAAAVASQSDRKGAVRLANLAAGLKVGKRGSVCISLTELEQQIADEHSSSSRSTT
jgi:D-beta-D-heptose 7-phosphate kinase / D-beta-D-heptose 1-phosphate adenosyltransferase